MMKKISLFFSACFITAILFAQSEKYVAAMQPKILAVDTTRNVDALSELGAAFERIADAEKTQWLPYYYAALAHVKAGEMLMVGNSDMTANNSEKLDPYADKADALLSKAEALSKDNSEIFVVRKMIASLHLMGDVMNRYMTYLPAANQALETAKKLNPENPRVYLLEAQDKYFTPEQYGGSKVEAKKLFEEALKKYESFKPESELHPNWGKDQADYFISQIK